MLKQKKLFLLGIVGIFLILVAGSKVSYADGTNDNTEELRLPAPTTYYKDGSKEHDGFYLRMQFRAIASKFSYFWWLFPTWSYKLSLKME